MTSGFATNWYIYRMNLCSRLTLKTEISEVSGPEISRNRCFKTLLLEAVDETFSSLGDPLKQAFYCYLEKTFKIKKQDVPRKIGEFANAMEKIFGQGAKILEIQIMRRLYKKIGDDFEYFPEKDELSFIEYIEAALYQSRVLTTTHSESP